MIYVHLSLHSENQTSRAKHGMYIIGDAETASSVPMWRDVCQMLHDVGAIGNQLELVCSRHQETQIDIEEPQDFLRLSPEGGCDLPCDRRLDSCGHRCFSKCHSDRMHKVVACAQPCDLLLPVCQHPCQMICSEECGACTMLVNNFLLPCNHVLEQVECWETQLPITCTRLVPKVIPACGHVAREECWVDVSDARFKCTTACNFNLKCGHSCTGTCGACNTGVGGSRRDVHRVCERKCGRRFTTCSHVCTKPCHDGTLCGLCDSNNCQV